MFSKLTKTKLILFVRIEAFFRLHFISFHVTIFRHIAIHVCLHVYNLSHAKKEEKNESTKLTISIIANGKTRETHSQESSLHKIFSFFLSSIVNASFLKRCVEQQYKNLAQRPKWSSQINLSISSYPNLAIKANEQ